MASSHVRWSVLLALLAMAVGCERSPDTLWVAGKKPTPYSARERLIEKRARSQGHDGSARSGRAHDDAGVQKGGEKDAGGRAAPEATAHQADIMAALTEYKEAMDAKDPARIKAGLDKLGRFDHGELAKVLTRVLKRGDSTLAVPAATAAGALELEGCLRALYDRVLSDDVFLAKASALALGKLGDPAALPRLLKISKEHKSPSVRSAAVMALGLLGGDQALATVQEATKDQDPMVRAAAAEVLGRIGSPELHHRLLASMLRDQAVEVRIAAALSLTKLRAPEAVDSLVGLLADPLEEARRKAEDALTRFPDRLTVRTKLMDAMEHGDPTARLSYSQALKAVCDCTCLPDIHHMAKHGSNEFVKNAARALAQEIEMGCR